MKRKSTTGSWNLDFILFRFGFILDGILQFLVCFLCGFAIKLYRTEVDHVAWRRVKTYHLIQISFLF